MIPGKIHIRRQRRNVWRRQRTLFIIPVFIGLFVYHWNLTGGFYARFYQRYRRGIGINLND